MTLHPDAMQRDPEVAFGWFADRRPISVNLKTLVAPSAISSAAYVHIVFGDQVLRPYTSDRNRGEVDCPDSWIWESVMTLRSRS